MFWKVAVLCGAAVGAASAQTQSVRVVEEIAAKVNGDIVTRGELAEKNKEIEGMLRQQGLTGTKLAEAIQENTADALRDEIDQLLLVQKAKEMPNLNVDADVTKFFNEWQTQAKITDPDKFHEWLRAQSGMTFDELKDRKKKELMAQRVVGYEVASRVAIPEGDLQKYYDEHKADFVRQEQVFLSEILISTEGKTAEQAEAAEAKAKDLSARAKKGEKFSDLARDNSDDLGTAQNGGYLGYPSTKGMLRPELEAIVFKEKKGFVTDPPIKLTNQPGFLILKVEEHFEAGQASFEEVQEDIHEILVGPLLKPKVREYLTQLRQQAYLQIKDGYVDSGAAPGKDTRWQEVAMLKPPVTTKEEVAARAKPHKKVLFVPIPGTRAALKVRKEPKAADDLQAVNNPPPPKPSKKPLPAAAAVAPIKQ
ncbi:MAG: peptidylprolyl isomerase [Bryobacteraceae bacterium]|jgi:parvulin-like peptidyl-prolyl isomerase